MTARRRPTALALVLAVLAAACGIDDDAVGGPDAPAPSTTTAPAPRGVPALEWVSCGGDLESAEVQVPLDHDEPTGATTTIAVLRVPAREPTERVGPLFVNPGGPGGSGTQLAAGLADALPDELRDRFDVVGFDPRGVGESNGLACTAGVVDMYRADPTVESDGDRRRLLETSDAFISSCTDGSEALLAHVGTLDAARDMDLLRRAMGDEQLSYLGYSYGTAIGQVHADRFPEHVRAMVLDGVVDLTRPGVEGAVDQARGFEQALERWAGWCRGSEDCPVAEGPMGAVDQVTAAAERTPIPAPGEDRPAGPGEVSLAVAQALYDPRGWDDLAAAVGDARDRGDGAALVDLADRYLGMAEFGAYFAVSCLDARWPDTDGLLAAAEDAGRAAPHFGEALVNDYLRCSRWPVPPDPVTAPSPGADLPPVLVISTVGDPATPYESGVAVADRLAHGVLLTHEGDGHTVALSGNACVDDKVVRYLTELEPPADGTRCAP